MKLEHFIRESADLKHVKYKTVNINEDLHLFFKRTANHYNLALSELMYNILSHWKNEYQDEIKKDMLNDLD